MATTSITSSTSTGIPDSWWAEVTGPAKDIDDAYGRGEVPVPAPLEAVAKEWGLQGDGVRSAAVTMACLLCFPAQTKDGDQRTVANLQKWSGYPRQLIEDTLARLVWNGIWAEQGMVVDWFEDETDTCCMTDCMVGAGILRRMIAQDGQKMYCMQLPDRPQGTPLPELRKKGMTAKDTTVWMVAKALEGMGHSHEDALLVAHRAWLGVPIPPWHGYFSPQRAKYYVSRVTRPPRIPTDTLAVWNEYLTTWKHYLKINHTEK